MIDKKQFVFSIIFLIVIAIALHINIENELNNRPNNELKSNDELSNKLNLGQTYLAEVFLKTEKEQGNISVYFCSNNNNSDNNNNSNCEEEFNKFISNADNFVYCAMYDIKLNSFVNSIQDAKNNNIEIKIITDDKTSQSKNSKYDELKQILGLDIKTDNRAKLMHNKFCIKDNKSVLTGSTNPTYTGIGKNANNLIVIDSKYLAQNYWDEFMEMQNNEFGDKDSDKVKNPVVELENTNFGNVKMQNYFCPEDNCENQVIKNINNANNSIYFCLFSFTSDNTNNALIEAANRGVFVYGIFDKVQSGSKDSAFDKLKNQNNSFIKIEKDNKPGFLHHKFFVIDNSTIITGSLNPTISGYFYNDENIIIIENKKIAQKFLEEYDCQRAN